MFNIPLGNQSQYNGEYLGGSTAQKRGFQILMKFENTAINLFQYYSDKQRRNELVSDRPFISIPYNNVVGVNVVSQESISTLRVFVLGLIPGLIFRKNEKFLLLTFKDEGGLEQNFVFRFPENYVVCSTIQKRVVENKKKTVF